MKLVRVEKVGMCLMYGIPAPVVVVRERSLNIDKKRMMYGIPAPVVVVRERSLNIDKKRM